MAARPARRGGRAEPLIEPARECARPDVWEDPPSVGAGYIRPLQFPMRAMVLDEPGRALRAARLPDPVAGPGQVLLRVAACGVCRTDLHVVDGELTEPKLPLVPGHQIVGRVEAVGAGAEVGPGERVGVRGSAGRARSAGTAARAARTSAIARSSPATSSTAATPSWRSRTPATASGSRRTTPTSRRRRSSAPG